MRKSALKSGSKRSFFLCIAVLAALPQAPAWADRYYVGPATGASARWNSTASWSATSGGAGGAGLPASTDNVYFSNADSVTRSVLLDVSSNILGLSIDNTGGGTTTLNQTGTNVTLNATNVEYIGGSGSGNFNQSIGTNNCAPGIDVGNSVTGVGSYTLSGTGLVTSSQMIVGSNGNGTLTQLGGTMNLSSGLHLAYNTNAQGTYLLSGGSLNAGSEDLGSSTNTHAAVTQTGGINTDTGNLYLGVDPTSSSSSYTLSGSGQLAVTGSIDVGGLPFAAGGTGEFTVQGGTASVAGTLKIYNGNPNNYILLSSGTLSAGTLDTQGNPGNFIWYGGKLVITNSALSISSTGPLGNSLTLGSLQTLGITSPASLVNHGSIKLTGGTITGTGTFTNSADGIVAGTGTISSPIINNGAISITDGLLTLNGLTNNGTLKVAGDTADVTGTTITNNAAVQGHGQIAAPITNNGLIEATGGTLSLTGAVTNPGTIRASNQNEILFLNGSFPTNAGLISMTGGTIDTLSQTLNNTGQITGYGTLATGGLTNAGSLTFTGGTSTINGNVTNNSGKTINVKYQPAIFTGNVVNNGTFKITNTTATFSGSYSGNAYVSDPSDNLFQANVTIFNGGIMTGGALDRFFFSGGVITNNGTFSNAGYLQSSDPVINSGSFFESGAQNWSGGTTFTNTAGTATFNSDSGAGGANLSVIVSSGAVGFGSTQHLAGLSISPSSVVTVTGGGSGLRSVITTSALTVNGTLDLSANDLDVQGGSLSAITTLIAQGYSQGHWNGTGINSSAAANDGSHLTAVGVILNYGGPGTPIYSTFDGASVALNDVLAKYTYFGDANLDGQVDGSDYSRIDAGFIAHSNGWFNGDFNYDGLINGSDYTLIDNAYNSQAASLNAAVADPLASVTAAVATTGSAVPEPAAGLVVIACLAPLLRRRSTHLAGVN